MAVVQSIARAGAVCPLWPRTHAPALYSLEQRRNHRVITMRVACTCERAPWDMSGELAP